MQNRVYKRVMKKRNLSNLSSRFLNYIQKFRKPTNSLPIKRKNFDYSFELSKLKFADVIFDNIVELIIDLLSDVTLIYKSGNRRLFDFIVTFLNLYGKRAMYLLYKDGYVVLKIGFSKIELLEKNEYTKSQQNGKIIFESKEKLTDSDFLVVLESEHYQTYGESHYKVLQPFLKFIDNVLNASNTITEKLGVAIFATPTTPKNLNTVYKLDPEEKMELEKEIEKNYGALDTQNLIKIFSEELKFNTINLAGLDINLSERLKIGILAIVDKIKIPANQVGIIDANTSKAFANGSEISESDLLKYKTFERAFVGFVYRLFYLLDFKEGDFDYTIYNKSKLNNNEDN